MSEHQFLPCVRINSQLDPIQTFDHFNLHVAKIPQNPIQLIAGAPKHNKRSLPFSYSSFQVKHFPQTELNTVRSKGTYYKYRVKH